MSNFKVEKKELKNVIVLYLIGDLDAHTAPVFEKELEQAIMTKQYRIVVNLEGLDYISSAGLGVFMGFVEDVREFSGDIILSNVSDKVYSVFDLLGFPSIFKIKSTEKQAVASFS